MVSSHPGPIHVVASGLSRVADDPVRLLGLSAVALAADLVWAVSLWSLRDLPWRDALVIALLGWLLRGVVVAFARAGLVRLLLHARGLHARPGLLLHGALEAAGALATLVVTLVALLPWAGAGALLAAQGVLLPLPLLVVPVVLSGWLGGLLARGFLAAPALRLASGRRLRLSLGSRMVVLATGDAARIAGALLVVPSLLAWPVATASLVSGLEASPEPR